MEHSALWNLYRETGDTTARDTLVKESLGLVHHIAKKMRKKLGNMHDHAELVSAGSIGLLGAISSFDPSRGFAFSTFAAQRIRGAILDDLREADPLSRSARCKRQQAVAAERELEQRLERTPTAPEIAAEMDLDLETYWQIRELEAFEMPVSLDAEETGNTSVAERIGEWGDSDDILESEDRVSTVQAALLVLSDQERLVVSLNYFEQLNLRQIGTVLDLTESRISQIRSSALRKLRVHMAAASPSPAVPTR